jgi:decaprenylphospho-beta-D-ribofuranose 2-oxidase
MQISGWGRYPIRDVPVFCPVSRREWDHATLGQDQRPYSPRGLGRSYGDAALPSYGGRSISTAFLNRFIALDAENGVLTAEAGLSLDEILDVIVPRGFFLPVTPGTAFVTLGGAVASNVHGKNHHHVGSIEGFILGLEVATPIGLKTCSPTENADLFRATVGGYGLTGCIVQVTLQLVRIASASVRVKRLRAENLKSLFDLFREHDAGHAFSVAWMDSLAQGKDLGRGVLLLGDFAEAAVGRPLSKGGSPSASFGLPLLAPNGLLRPGLMQLFNGAYYHFQQEDEGLEPLRTYFYPLDRIRNWNRLYGSRGFLQYQCAIPDPQGEVGIEACLHFLAKRRLGSFLTVLKRCGDDFSGIPFCKRGYTLALDIPLHSPSIARELDALDDLVLRHGGRIYLTKDARLSASRFKAMVPEWEGFMETVRRYNPDGLCRSALSDRLELWGKER